MAAAVIFRNRSDLREQRDALQEARAVGAGYSPHVFKKAIDPRLFCRHCRCLLRFPVQAVCGDLFCRSCADSHLSEACPTCPVCMEPMSKVFCDLAIAKEMQQLPVTCENQRRNCTWEGVLKDFDMEMHLAGECLRQVVSCQFHSYGCTEQFLREDLDKHDREFAQQHDSYRMPGSKNSQLRKEVSAVEERNVVPTGCSGAAHPTIHDVTLSSTTTRSLPLALATTTAAGGGQEATISRNTEKIKKTEAATEKNSTDIAAVRALAVQDIQLSDVSLRLDIVDVKTANGVLVWKIGDIARRRREAQTGKTPSLYSAPFYTSPCGYKMCARIYLDGDGMGKGGCISVFFVLMRGEYDALLSWPFQLRVTMMLLDQSDTPLKRNITEVFKPDSRSASFKRPTAEMNTGSGCPMFSSVNVLDSPTYVKDDIIFIKVIVDKTSANYTPPDQERA